MLPSIGPKEQGQRQVGEGAPKTLPLDRSGLTEREMERFRRDFRSLDVSWLEREFRAWVAEREEPKDYTAAFYGFMKRKQREQNS
jgi:hypothetical protein